MKSKRRPTGKPPSARGVVGATKVGDAQERFVAQVETALGMEGGCPSA